MNDENLLNWFKAYWEEALNPKLDYIQKGDDDYCDNPGPKWKARYWACWSW